MRHEASDTGAAEGSPWPAAGTIVTRNYLSRARILGESYLEHHPGGRFYVLAVDGLPEGSVLPTGMIRIDGSDLGLPYFHEICFKYNPLELCCALKPSLLSALLDRYGERAAIYLDSDTLVFRPLEEMRSVLGRPAIVLTPHLVKPVPPGPGLGERVMIRCGIFNAGCVAVSASEEARSFLRWWEERLRDQCVERPEDGLRHDQRWLDLVPSLFGSTAVLKDETYNVAFWNLATRILERRDGNFLVNGRPLAFFHFAGYDLATRSYWPIDEHWTEVAAGSPLAALMDLYGELHEKHDHALSSRWEYGFSRFSDGSPIDRVMRALYGGLEPRRRDSFGNPFRVDEVPSFFDWAVSPGPGDSGLSPYLKSLYALRKDVATAFPDVDRKDRAAFLHWASTSGAREMGYDPGLVRSGDRT